MNQVFKKSSFYIVAGIIITSSNTVLAKTMNNGDISSVNIPKVFKDLLSDGMPLIAKVKYNGNNDSHLDGIIRANIYLKHDKLILSYIDVNNKTLFTDDFNKKIESLKNIPFNKNGKIKIDNNAHLSIDITEMDLSLYISQSDFAKNAEKRELGLNNSSVESLTSMLSYDFGISNSWGKGENYNNNYLNLNSISGYGEHHIIVEGSLFAIGTSQQSEDLRRVLYEKDHDGRRFAFGILSGWDLQSLGQVNALNSKRIWGMSYGNKSNSTHIDESKSYTPIFVFLPSQGEVRVYKENKLISIQNFGLGNHEVDTTSFPSGSYNVRVDVIVNGKTVSSNIQKVSKLSYSNGFSKEASWQIWGGFMEPYGYYYDDKQVVDDPTYLIGISNSLSFENNYITSSLYSFDSNFLSEVQIDSRITDWLDISNQLMLASDGSWKTVNSATVSIFKYGTIWGNIEKSEYGKKINEYDTDSYGYGGTINLNSIYDKLGTLTYSRQIDNYFDYDYLTLSYYQHLYSGPYGSLSLNLDYYKNTSQYSKSENKSISFEYTIPLGSKFSAGMSKDATGSLAADLSYDDRDINQYISALGVDISSQIEDEHDVYLSSYVNYQTDILDGSVNMSRSVDGNYSMNLSGNGSVSLRSDGVNVSGGNNGDAGIVIRTNLDSDKSIEANIDGNHYVISGKETLIPLDGYKEYNIELNNNDKIKDSFEIVDKKRSFTLYPGNIYTFDASESIREMVTVFGILKDKNGQRLKNVKAYNHIGSTTTDNEGNFVIDVNKNIPIMSSYNADGDSCEAELELKDSSGAVWIGETICKEKVSYASN